MPGTRVAAWAAAACLVAAPAAAQVVRDGSVGRDASVQVAGPDYVIGETLGERSGAHLFHSFSEFSLGAGESATFTGPDAVQNVISRVTGGSSSTIFGALRSEIPRADLYLLNPAGIAFGPGASLDVQGSFFASTADRLEFSNGATFEASLGSPVPMVEVADPARFGFLSANAASIEVAGATLFVGPQRTDAGEPLHETLALVGGPRSRIEVRDGATLNASGEGAGEILIRGGRLVVDGSALFASNVGPHDAAPSAIDLELQEGVSLRDAEIRARAFGAGAGGKVRIRAPDLEVLDSIVSVEARADGASGALELDAEALRVSDDSLIKSEARGAGRGGDIHVTAESVTVEGGSQLFTDTFGTGRGGDFLIRAGTLVLERDDDPTFGTFAATFTSGTAPGSGRGGDLDVRAASVELRKGAQLNVVTDGAGDSGSLVIHAGTVRVGGSFTAPGPGGQTFISFIRAPVGFLPSSRATGTGGDIRLHADTLIVEDGGQVGADSRPASPGDLGRVELHAKTILLVGGGDQPTTVGLAVRDAQGGGILIEADQLFVLDGAVITTDTLAAGDSGDLEIEAGRIVISGRGPLGNRSGVFAQTLGSQVGDRVPGPGRDIRIQTESLEVSDSGLISTTSAGTETATGGNIIVNDPAATSALETANAQILLENGAEIRSRADNRGDGGRIELHAARIELRDGALITADSTSLDARAGAAGQVTLFASDSLRLVSSQISTRAENAFGGSISINGEGIEVREDGSLAAGGTAPGALVELRDSSISTSVTNGSGDGGNVLIDADLIVLDPSPEPQPAPVITANAEGEGDGGNILLVADSVVATAGLDDLLEASSRRGVSGRVEVRSPAVDLVGRITPLPQSLLGAADLLRDACRARRAGTVGSFVVTPSAESPISPAGPRPVFAGAWRNGAAPAAPGEVTLDTHLAAFESALLRGDLDDAAHHAEWAHALAERSHDAAERVAALDALATLALTLGDHARAEAHLDAALDAAQGLPAAPQSALRINRANLAASRERYESASEGYREAAAAARDVAGLRATALSNAAWAESELPWDEPGSPLLESARRAAGALPDSSAKARLLLQLALVEGKGMGPRPIPSRRARVTGACTETAAVAERAGDALTLARANGCLAELHAGEERHAEALERTQRALLHAQAAGSVGEVYRSLGRLGRLYRARAEPARAGAAYEDAARIYLQRMAGTSFKRYARAGSAFDDEVRPVLSGLLDFLLEREASLEDEAEQQRILARALELLEAFRADEVRDYFDDRCAAVRREVAHIPGTVVVYPVFLRDRVELIVQRQAGERSRLGRIRVAGSAEQVEHQVRLLRRFLEKRATQEYLRPATDLYDRLMRPVEAWLGDFPVETLVFVPSGALRTVPMSALYDGEAGRFLIEKYPVAISPGLTLTDPRPIDPERVSVLIAGLTGERSGFVPLPYIRSEIEAIQQLFPHRSLIDDAFVVERLERELHAEAFGILHIASHGEFGVDAASTFVATHDAPLTMKRLSDLVAITAYREQPLELLTLSACETARGDDRSRERAALGLAGVAVDAGARSALATLWPIDDEAASQVIEEFYAQLRTPPTSRARALQRAQVKLLRGRRYRHPGYWAPFLMISSWL